MKQTIYCNIDIKSFTIKLWDTTYYLLPMTNFYGKLPNLQNIILSYLHLCLTDLSFYYCWVFSSSIILSRFIFIFLHILLQSSLFLFHFKHYFYHIQPLHSVCVNSNPIFFYQNTRIQSVRKIRHLLHINTVAKYRQAHTYFIFPFSWKSVSNFRVSYFD